MTSPPLLVWVIAAPNDRQGAARLHALVSSPFEATNVRCAVAAAGAAAPASTRRRTLRVTREGVDMTCPLHSWVLIHVLPLMSRPGPPPDAVGRLVVKRLHRS